MFLKIEKKKSGIYARLVRSYRDKDGIPKHETVYNIGNVNLCSKQDLINIGNMFLKLGGNSLQHLHDANIKEISRQNYGYEQVYCTILQKWGLYDLFQSMKKKNLNVANVMQLLLMERLNKPVSKLASYKRQKQYLTISQENISLQHIYRSLDYLAKEEETVKKLVFQRGQHSKKQKVDLIFYDVTTFYFDSQKIAIENIRKRGFSKDGKTGKTQVVFGLLIDRDKRPIDYFVYEGNQYEGHTFVDALDALKAKYQIQKAIVVADSGMMSNKNRSYMEENTDYTYIMGERLKSLPADVQAKLTNLANYKNHIKVEGKDKVVQKIRYYILHWNGRKLICTYSQKRATKDFLEREELLAKAAKMLEHPSLLNRKASRFFLKKTSSQKYIIDLEKIAQAEKYDGFFCIATNNHYVHTATILDHYKHLFQIEHSFRTMKSYLETRPMFHWTNRRIKAHLCLCYIAYALLTEVQYLLKKAKLSMSEGDIRAALWSMETSLIEQSDKKYYMVAPLTVQAATLLKALKIRSMPMFFPEQHLGNYICSAKAEH